MTPEYTIYFTAANGEAAAITGSEAAIDSIVTRLKKTGAWYNSAVESWDEGFYHSSSARARKAGHAA